jgi:NAD(P)H dehydrogenase (quinone)
MGHILVLYFSQTGHTRRMAELVAEAARESNHDVRLLDIGEATAEDALWADGIALGSPTWMGGAAWPMKRWWDETNARAWGKLDGKIGCAFSSQGGMSGGAELTCLSLLTTMMNYGMLTFGVTDYVGKRTTLHYGPTAVKMPDDEEEQAACRRLGTRLAEWVSVLVDGDMSHHPCRKGKP